jgi:hypothetical protein
MGFLEILVCLLVADLLVSLTHNNDDDDGDDDALLVGA